MVSIVTVVRNGAATLEQCILSVLSQRYENTEYIVIDGASTDGTIDIIRRYADALDYFVAEPDKGIYDAMNKGLRLASGDYILILNADDWYTKNAVESLVSRARESDADIAHANAWVVSGAGRQKQMLRPWLHDGIYTRGMPLRHETMLVARNVYDRFGGYDDSYEIIADFVWTLKVYEGGCSFVHLDEPVLYFRSNGISNTAHEIRVAERVRLFQALFPFLDDEDLNVISSQGFGIQKRLSMLRKHKRKSELFARSMAYNIAEYSRSTNAEILRRVIAPLRKSFLWPFIAPPVRWMKNRITNSRRLL